MFCFVFSKLHVWGSSRETGSLKAVSKARYRYFEILENKEALFLLVGAADGAQGLFLRQELCHQLCPGPKNNQSKTRQAGTKARKLWNVECK